MIGYGFGVYRCAMFIPHGDYFQIADAAPITIPKAEPCAIDAGFVVNFFHGANIRIWV